MLHPPRPQPTAVAADALDGDATRRSFLKKVALGGAAAAVGTQLLPLDRLVPGAGAQEDGDSGGDSSTETTEAGTESETGPELTPDQERITFLAGIALAGAAAFRAAAGDEGTDGASEGEESEDASGDATTTTLPPIEVPPLAEPVVEVLRVFGSHHSQQATAMNAGLEVVVEAPNSTLLTEVRSGLSSAADEAAVLELLRDLSERIAATHLEALGEIEDSTDAQLVATALPVVAQHAVVLGTVAPTPVPLEELIPEEQTTDGALTQAEYPSQSGPDTEDTPGDTGSEQPEGSAGGEGADPDTDTGGTPADGTEASGGGADDGSSTDAGGSASDPESEG
ncbi:twin-arginine translocation signal domain-containing protein [Iamia sp. SCSIO 61187]|uniref:twin-arginine translocation signal domain-containing protein n=1 Tax=Iamia sp. SCSIO 61187 TaxID=2722752 RepID=UPI001C62EDAC|nr:twin-arginine translocation signal domain-containing protein [Iamia sp. SCSIO 61187]QYG93746.1 twin-arginine translocation signal domain-containing protein [Iamia sp. SCSIO 61187]